MMLMITTTGNELVAVLERLGIDITRVSGSEVGAKCPVHEDHSPSWSMNINTGLWICYACGAKGNLSQLVMQLTGSSDEALLVNQFIIESGLERIKERVITQPPPTVDLGAFRRFVPVPEDLLVQRQLDKEMAHRFGLRWDPEPRHWIIPIISQYGDLWGWQAKTKGYFRNVPTGVTKSLTLFGVDRFKAETAVLLESPLDVVRLASIRPGVGVYGLASFGAHVSNEQLNILIRKADKLVVALDNDEAGITAAQRIFESCPHPRGGITFLRYEHTNAKDLGDMTNDEIDEAISGASVLPWWL